MSQVTSPSNAALCYKAKKFLESKGHKVKTTDLHAMFAHLCDEPSLHHATARQVSFAKLFTKTDTVSTVAEHGSEFRFACSMKHEKKQLFDVKIKGTCEVRKFYRLAAKDREEAQKIMEEYIKSAGW